MKYGRITQEGVQIMGVTENWSRMGSVRELTAGRHLIEDDEDRARPVAVIGGDLVDAFFTTAEPLGKSINIDGYAIRVVGVAARKGKIFGESQDNFVWIPLDTFRKMVGTRRSITIQAQAASMEQMEAAQDQARVIMRVRRHLGFGEPDDFNIETGESVMEFWQSATRGIYVVTILVTAISLIIGGVVVMNIMLVSVTERIREIGVRKALGARRRDILRQFLVESVVLSLFGGAAGRAGCGRAVLPAGAGAGRHHVGRLQRAGRALGGDAGPVRVERRSAWWPASIPRGRAAMLDPVEALRQE